MGSKGWSWPLAASDLAMTEERENLRFIYR